MKLYDNAGNPCIDIDTSKEINRGGEGTIYAHPTRIDEVVKVYHTNGNLSTSTLTELMQLPTNFIKPLELFYDKSKRLKALSMKYLDTKSLSLLSNIFSKASAQKGGFTSTVRLLICRNLATALVEAHRVGVIIGDLNPYNIFCSSNGEVFFIDVDSFQTLSRKHSGVMLPDIRDWLSQSIDEKSDYFALSILMFNLMTHVHPYKGVHKTIKTIEERVIRRISLLSGDKDLIIPSFYEPFGEPKVADQFYHIFQKDQRVIPIVSGGTYTQSFVPKGPIGVATIKEGDLAIKTIAIGVEDFNCTDNYFYIRKNTDQFTICTCRTQGTYSPTTQHIAQQVLLGNKNVVIVQYGRLHNVINGDELIHNFIEPFNSSMYCNNGQCIYFDGSTDTYSLLHIDEILNGTHIAIDKGIIYTKSVTVQQGVTQAISGQKWILDISSGVMITLRSPYIPLDVYMSPSGKYGVLETKDTQGIEHHLFSVSGMTITRGSKLDGMQLFAEKGDYLYIPTNGAMDVYRKLDLMKVATIACKYVNEQSVLKTCNAGILCLTGDTLYLFNKA